MEYVYIINDKDIPDLYLTTDKTWTFNIDKAWGFPASEQGLLQAIIQSWKSGGNVNRKPLFDKTEKTDHYKMNPVPVMWKGKNLEKYWKEKSLWRC